MCVVFLVVVCDGGVIIAQNTAFKGECVGASVG